jgi:immunoglobulin-binding protein 1
MLAEIKIKSYGAQRLNSLHEAAELLESFLTRLEQYRLLEGRDQELYERFLERRESFRVVSSSNPEEKRKVKIARFQEEKSLKQKLQAGFSRTSCSLCWLIIVVFKNAISKPKH